ncbi:hypothetical protein SAMN05216275_106186 [Streptosporangium canum]|uniref:Uncharacterized protein n=1 Tax=Streptosporangium canum TaxID=324952 RepID=A0A1I3NEC5_9ACTN|nr:hypothetical protein SAMN05216275_106186 [Streptosporangium canum]
MADMGHSQADKAATRERVLRITSRKVRAEGVTRPNTADLMKEAGLTHGGFCIPPPDTSPGAQARVRSGPRVWRPWGELEAGDEDGPTVWTPDALTVVAREQGIDIARSQVRRILLKEGARRSLSRAGAGPWRAAERSPLLLSSGQ